MDYEIIFSQFIGTQRVVRVKETATGKVYDFTPDTLEADELPEEVEQFVQEHMERINSGYTDYDGLFL